MDDQQNQQSPFENQGSESSSVGLVELGKKIFEWRDYTPVPLLIIVLFTAEPRVSSATIGTLLLVLGEIIRIYTVAFIKEAGASSELIDNDRLLTKGPFDIVRCPLYLANLIVALGVTVFGGVGWVLFLIMALMIVQYMAINQYEDQILKEKFGEEFTKYCEGVPTWIPKRFPRPEEWPEAKHIALALKDEQKTLFAIGLMLIALILVAN